MSLCCLWNYNKLTAKLWTSSHNISLCPSSGGRGQGRGLGAGGGVQVQEAGSLMMRSHPLVMFLWLFWTVFVVLEYFLKVDFVTLDLFYLFLYYCNFFCLFFHIIFCFIVFGQFFLFFFFWTIFYFYHFNVFLHHFFVPHFCCLFKLLLCIYSNHLFTRGFGGFFDYYFDILVIFTTVYESHALVEVGVVRGRGQDAVGGVRTKRRSVIGWADLEEVLLLFVPVFLYTYFLFASCLQ